MHKKWYRLDTAALIFPAVARRNWSNCFRLSVNLNEKIDPELLQQALDDMRMRFPTFFVTLRKGTFWYYFEESRERLRVRRDYAYPLTYMSRRELRRNCVRVLYHDNRIAAEFFHSTADGHGGGVFLSNLTARYLELKHNIDIPHGDLVKDINGPAPADELEDSFWQNASDMAADDKEPKAYHLDGTLEREGFRYLTTGIANTESLVEAAHRCNVSVTAFLSAVLAKSIIEIQNIETPKKKQKPVKVTVAIDLRRYFKSISIRNFALALNLGVDPRYGEYSIEEIANIIYHQLRANATKQNLTAMITANVLPQQITALRLAPLFIKKAVMNMVYEKRGESLGSINISNMNRLAIPNEMQPYIERMEFIIGPQRSYYNNCSVLSYGEKTYINMIRSIKESELERRFFSHLVELGVPIEIESNRRT